LKHQTPVTRRFDELVLKRAARGQVFAEALLREGIDLMLAGEVDIGKSHLRDYIKGTIGFEKLGPAIGAQPKSLIRMFGSSGNPQARNLFKVLSYLQKKAGVEFRVAATSARQRNHERGFTMPTPRHEIPEWLELTHSAEVRDRRWALHALCPCELKSHAPEVWRRVLQMVNDPDPSVRRRIIHVLCDGSPAIYQSEIVRALEDRYNDPDRSVRRMARHVLARYRHSGNLNTL